MLTSAKRTRRTTATSRLLPSGTHATLLAVADQRICGLEAWPRPLSDSLSDADEPVCTGREATLCASRTDAVFAHAGVLQQREEYEESERFYLKALQLSPDNPDALYTPLFPLCCLCASSHGSGPARPVLYLLPVLPPSFFSWLRTPVPL